MQKCRTIPCIRYHIHLSPGLPGKIPLLGTVSGNRRRRGVREAPVPFSVQFTERTEFFPACTGSSKAAGQQNTVFGINLYLLASSNNVRRLPCPYAFQLSFLICSSTFRPFLLRFLLYHAAPKRAKKGTEKRLPSLHLLSISVQYGNPLISSYRIFQLPSPGNPGQAPFSPCLVFCPVFLPFFS